MLDQLQSLLDQISEIIHKEKELKQKKYDSGETFNVFEILGLQRKEVRLHSSFIASLLDPRGPHGLRTKPLELFLQVMNAEGILQDLTTVKVETEMYIGTISNRGNEGGRLDIVLTDTHKHAIVIENKIDAGDQPKQLLRYDNYCKKHFGNDHYRIIYLTKWGEDPSEQSCGGKDIDYRLASYKEDILSWVNRCIDYSEMVPSVHETLKQYRTNLVEILNIMSEKSENEFLSIATADKNIESTLSILERSYPIERKIRFDFLANLLALAKRYGFTGNKEEAEQLADLTPHTFLGLLSPVRSSHYGLFIGNDTPSDGFWFGIGATTKKRVSKTTLQQMEPLWGNRKDQKIDYPYGSDYFWSETGEKDSGNWWKWDDYDTLRAMCDGRFLDFIKKEVLQKTVELHLLEKLEDFLK